MRFDYHIFICANQKAEGKVCCGQERGLELVAEFRRVLRDKGLQGKVRAQRAGCIDACDFGPSVVIYPGGEYYGHLKPENVETIIEQHIIGGKAVEEFLITF